MIGFLTRFVLGFLAFSALLAALVALAAWRAPGYEYPSAGYRPYTAETWERVPEPAAKAPREAAKAPRKAAKEPATVTEARRWSACHGPACYHDVRPEAAPFLNKGL